MIYFFKGLGAYFSTYLMTDVGQRVVRDIRDQLFRHILESVGAFFSRRTTGQLMSRITNDVDQVQQAVSETIGDLLREGLPVVGFAVPDVLLRLRLALVVVTGAPLVVYPLVRLGQRVRRSTRREPGRARAPVAPHRRSVHRPSHRQGVRRRGARGARFRRASERLYRTNLKVTSTVSVLPPIMEFLGGVAVVGLLWYGSRRIGAGEHDAGRVPRVHLRGVHDVHADQEAEPRQREPAAGDRRGDADLRDARHAFRGHASGPGRAALAPLRARDRVPRRQLRVRRRGGDGTC